MKTLEHKDVKVKSYKIHLIEMIINAIYYNPVSFNPCCKLKIPNCCNRSLLYKIWNQMVGQASSSVSGLPTSTVSEGFMIRN